ncbi:MAG: hypothetical protein WKG07_09590 [Hymenobacter sp.]
MAADRRPGHLLHHAWKCFTARKRSTSKPTTSCLYATVRGQDQAAQPADSVHQLSKRLQGMERQLPYLRAPEPKTHLLLVVFFENTELRTYLDAPADTTADVYNQTIAEKFAAGKAPDCARIAALRHSGAAYRRRN